MKKLGERLHKQPVWIALIITLCLVMWIASGYLSAQSDETSVNEKTNTHPISKVQTTIMHAERVNRDVTLYGRTEPDRIATVRAEVNGRVIEVLAERGSAVSKGDVLVKLDPQDRHEQLAFAKALLGQRETEFNGIEALKKQGYQAQTALAEAQANLESARAQVSQLELALENSVVVAPFDGVLNERVVEVGDYLREGDEIATIVDLQPLVFTAHVTESDIASVTLGQQASARLISGEQVTGRIRYISNVSNEGTNTFTIEVAVANPDNALLAGLSGEIFVTLKQVNAIKITPSVMALDEDGNLGVKVVENNRVRFISIDMVKSEADGVWLAGLGEQAEVITRGQGFVRDGDSVEVVNN